MTLPNPSFASNLATPIGGLVYRQSDPFLGSVAFLLPIRKETGAAGPHQPSQTAAPPSLGNGDDKTRH